MDQATTGDDAAVLDWPVRRGGAVVVRPEDEAFWWRPGTGEDDRFALASVTKPMTALAVLAAVEAGHLRLDTEVPWPDGLRPVRGGEAAGPVTVRHLLAHASGLPTERDGTPLPPERRRVYSNVGVRQVADVTARAVGEPFGDWLGRSVLDPLLMRHTAMGERLGLVDDPASGAFSTLPDLALLASCLLDGGAPVVGPDLFAEAVSVQFPGLAGLVPGIGRFDPCDWGLGFELKDGKAPHWMGERRSPRSFGHFGASGCFVWVDPDAGVAAAAVTDRDFHHDWAMAAWPAWSDAVAPAG